MTVQWPSAGMQKEGGLVLLCHKQAATEWHQLCAQVLMSSVVTDEHHKSWHTNQFVPRSLTIIMDNNKALLSFLSLWLLLLSNKRILTALTHGPILTLVEMRTTCHCGL